MSYRYQISMGVAVSVPPPPYCEPFRSRSHNNRKAGRHVACHARRRARNRARAAARR